MNFEKYKTVKAWAWECDFGLVFWSESDRDKLTNQKKPSPEAKSVMVRMMKNTDWQKIKKVILKYPDLLKEIED